MATKAKPQASFSVSGLYRPEVGKLEKRSKGDIASTRILHSKYEGTTLARTTVRKTGTRHL